MDTNRIDERLSKFGYAELFKLPLEREEAAALVPQIEAALAGREGLPWPNWPANLGTAGSAGASGPAMIWSSPAATSWSKKASLAPF